ncbi:MAG TPA: type II toxin-antitoxin system HipA family toxin [Rhizomicrobium sp.]|jgi:serine/threonine-protein kinase HipA
MAGELVALLGGVEVGRVATGDRNRLTFIYDDRWRNAPNACPLSLSMSLAAPEHGPAATEAFLWGLLPDNEFVLDSWARRFQVSARNVFALISHVGEDCAGAVQFVRPERVSAVKSGRQDRIDWLSEAEIAERLRILKRDHAAWRLPRDTGQFSLAGAQPKTALLFDGKRWGIPSGRPPTTHILKPPTGHFDGHAENEHICLALARAAGLPAARSRVAHFEDEVAIVVERYDRQRHGGEIVRVHQEDTCQSLALPPSRKYQNEGGPGVAQIVDLLRTWSSAREADIDTFIRSVAFNWLIAGTDAHARNYSLLIAPDQRVRLAPLYDVASILPYDEFDLRKAKMAMKIGGEYRLHAIGVRQWRKLASEVRIDGDRLILQLREMARLLPDSLSDVRNKAIEDGLDHPLVGRLAERLAARIAACARGLE